MKALWQAGEPLTRPELEARLAQHHWASTTLLALLARLEAKGYVAREKQGRGYLYRAALSRRDYLPVESRSALARLFEGSAKNLVAAMAESDALTDRDIAELEEYLAELKAGRGGT
ncbi:MAG TPA: BlaI/MecI/CopY family transcriptional regulator [Candidatus Gemmiger stercorigallinarum]|nr:BlaI/MecI/CopY family transcriptional regulator [Candidatus Gemmiger stercorigallinarum]